ESLHGFRRRGDRLSFDPRVPPSWTEFSVEYRHGSATYRVRVENPGGVEHGVRRGTLDGRGLEGAEGPAGGEGREAGGPGGRGWGGAATRRRAGRPGGSAGLASRTSAADVQREAEAGAGVRPRVRRHDHRRRVVVAVVVMMSGDTLVAADVRHWRRNGAVVAG